MRHLEFVGGKWIDAATGKPFPPPDARGRQIQPLAQLNPGDTFTDRGTVRVVVSVTRTPEGQAIVIAE